MQVIRSFKDPEAEGLFSGTFSRPVTAGSAGRPSGSCSSYMRLGNSATWRRFPGNRLEALAGDRRGQHSIRVNDQYRICFVWHDGDADDVEIVDYH